MVNSLKLLKVRSLPTFPPRYREAIAVALVVIAALLLRTVDLTTLPAGFHGDEGVVGLESQRILRDGYIGVYSPYAAGQPTGPIYLMALSVWILGDTVLAVRIVPALLGTLTVPLLYIILRRNFGISVALIGSSVLTVMSWHIYFARIAFPLEAWPLIVLATAGAVVEAVRGGGWRWWVVFGALTGAGIYVYNAQPVVWLIVFLFLAGHLIVRLRWPEPRELARIAAFAAAMIAVMIPMIRFATADDTYYWRHFERARITETEAWQALDGPVEQARFVVSNYVRIWGRLSWGPEVDIVDGTGFVEVVPLLMLGLAAIGIVFALWLYRNPLVYFGVLMIFITPIGAALSEGGETRRTLIMAPFIAMFCALGCVGMLEMVKRRRPALRYAGVALAAALVAIVMYQNVRLYFHDFADPEIQRRVLAQPVAGAAKFLDGLPYDPYVYFYSETWRVDYETMQYIAPDVRGENRSDRFGTFSLDIDLDDPTKRCPLMVFLGTRMEAIDDIRRLYPGQEITPDQFTDRPTFRVYEPRLDDEDTSSCPNR